MTIGKEDISRLKIQKSEIDENLVSVLRDIQEVFGTEAFFKDDAEELDSDDKFMTVSIKGVGFTNVSKKIA